MSQNNELIFQIAGQTKKTTCYLEFRVITIVNYKLIINHT